MPQPPFRRKRIAALVAFICHYWNQPEVLTSVKFPDQKGA